MQGECIMILIQIEGEKRWTRAVWHTSWMAISNTIQKTIRLISDAMIIDLNTGRPQHRNCKQYLGLALQTQAQLCTEMAKCVSKRVVGNSRRRKNDVNPDTGM
jgi:tRNA-dihydrouridine synthase